MDQIKKACDQVKDFVSHSIDSSKLKPGDHVYCYRQVGTYTHHGIFVGDSDDNGDKKVLQVIHLNSTNKGQKKPHCPNCTTQSDMLLGVVKTCLDCFLKEGDPTAGRTIRLYYYGVSSVQYKVTLRGTSTTKMSNPPEEVVNTAQDFFINQNYGDYDVTSNNCEHFATFCKTGERSCAQAGCKIFRLRNAFSS